ncbi:rhodanese-like domain-containing protein [Nocardioides nematodiphilus]|uniref:rhodanese-like domain-containing protein n=1 Tax=Nocardioides nematodiphilus TaxID=2849669 RepID=UPI001CD91D39|nr:rhodanese-like domain-containing protein [Nocardioides nematodiphilus]MCA1981857.1 rhodanese-like domain-containing protein [Nocardioides nematodiphilus]
MSIPTVEINGVPDPIPVPVVDVREEHEWAAGHIEGAIHIPLGVLPVRAHELPEGQFLVVCHLGGRSAQAVQWLTRNGHDAVNLAGGMDAWEAAGRPTVV